ncbi:unnamed protein product [Oikopleura dioica]|uniref:Uncharacterized protein n=1 Tax=Oikopleura dioica TaxID=34765 RepID=E4X7B5_OIKDI|nr:unnamed protein product [Oikopleura dioica]
MYPRKIFADISSLDNTEKEHIRNVIARAEWVPGQTSSYTLRDCIRKSEHAEEPRRAVVKFGRRESSLSFHTVFDEEDGVKKSAQVLSPQKPSSLRVLQLRTSPKPAKAGYRKLERQRSVTLDDDALFPTARLPPRKLFFDDKKQSSQECPSNTLKVGLFPIENSFSLVLEECTIRAAIKPYLKLKYIPSGKKKRLEPIEIRSVSDGLIQLSFQKVTFKPREWERLNYLQIKLKVTQAILSNITCGTFLLDAANQAFRNKKVRCTLEEPFARTFSNYYRGGIEICARLRIDPEESQIIILEIVVDSVFNMPPDSRLVQVGALLWPLEKNVKFSSEDYELNDKRRAVVGHQFKFLLNSTVYKKNRDKLGIYLEVNNVTRLPFGRSKKIDSVGHTRISSTDPKSKVFLKKLKNRPGAWHKETFIVTKH